MSKAETEPDKRKPTVAVFGGGIAGLTAAHELAERGFDVTVYEKRSDPRWPNDGTRPELGGMARTQWCRLQPSAKVEIEGQGVSLELSLVEGKESLSIEGEAAERLLRFARQHKEGEKQEGEQPEAEKEEQKERAQTGSVPLSGPYPRASLPGSGDEKELAKVLMEHLRRVSSHYEWPCLELIYVTTGQVENEFELGDTQTGASPWTRKKQGGVDPRLANSSHTIQAVATIVNEAPDFSCVQVYDSKWAGKDESDEPEVETGSEESEASGEEEVIKIEVRQPDASGDPSSADSVFRRFFPPFNEPKIRLCLVFWNDRPVAVLVPRFVRGNERIGSSLAVRLEVGQNLLPGEHGYRFYPSFYAHLIDTMKRIPILRELKRRERTPSQHEQELQRDAPARWVETGRTVADNLISVPVTGIAADDGRAPLRLTRQRPMSLTELLGFADALQSSMGFSDRDIVEMQLSMMRYFMTGPSRRTALEHMTWAKYIGLEDTGRYSDAFREAMTYWPRALIGLDAHEIDARTFGSVTAQMLLDQLRPEGHTVDRTLNAPTTLGFIDPWRAYLEHLLEVKFCVGACTKLDFKDNCKPIVHIDGPGSADDYDYWVFALPVHVVRELAAEALGSGAPTSPPNSLRAIEGLLPVDDCTGKPHPPDSDKSPLRHFSGIQYFLRQDFRELRGHVYVAGSYWGLSLISQRQFWSRRSRAQEDIRGVLSVVIGDWRTKVAEDEKESDVAGKSAWECSPDEIASEVWRQIKRGYQRAKVLDASLPDWQGYHIDDEIEFPGPADPPSRCAPARSPRGNLSPYLVNLAGRYPSWPGVPGDYAVEFDRLVFCGIYMKTWTRLNTMEAANESARHAVTAILSHYRARQGDQDDNATELEGIGPMVRNMEEYELPDLGFLRDLDDELHRRGLPHLLEILRIQQAVAAAFEARGHANEGGKPSSTLVAILASLASSAGLGTAALKALLDLLGPRRAGASSY